MKSLFLFLTHRINYQDPYKLAPIRNVMQKKKKAHFEKKTTKTNKQTKNFTSTDLEEKIYTF